MSDRDVFFNKEVTCNWNKVIIVKISCRESLTVSVSRSSELIQLISMVERSCSMSGHLRMQTHTQLYRLMLIYPYATDANVSADCRGITSNRLRMRSSMIRFEFCIVEFSSLFKTMPVSLQKSAQFIFVHIHSYTVFKLIDTASNKRVIV